MNPLCVIGLNKLIWKTNDAFQQEWGYSKEDLEQRPFTVFIHPKDVDGFEKKWSKIKGSIPGLEFSCRIRKKDGGFIKQRWLAKMENNRESISITTYPTKFDAAQPEQWRDLVANNIGAIVYALHNGKNEKLKIEYVSPLISDLIGIGQHGDMSPGEIQAHYHPEDLGTVLKGIDQLLAKKKPVTISYRFLHAKTGKYIWLEERLTPRIEGDAITGVFGICSDISGQKTAQSRLEAIFFNVPVGMVQIDSAGQIVEANEKARSLMSWGSKSLNKRNLFECLHAEDKATFKSFEKFIAKGGLNARLESVFKGRQNTKIFCNTSFTHIDSGNDEPFILVSVEDTTQKKITELKQEICFNISAKAGRRIVDIQQVANYIDEELSRIFNTTNFQLVLDYDSNAVPQFAHYRSTHKSTETNPVKEVDLAFASYCMEHGKPFLVDQAGYKEIHTKEGFAKVKAHPSSVMALPLRSEGRTVGCMTLATYGKEKPFTTEELNSFIFISFPIAGLLTKQIVQQDLMRNEENFRSLIENSSDIFSILDREGKIQYISNSVENIFDISRHRLRGKSIFRFLVEGYKPKAIKYLLKIEEQEDKTLISEFKFRTHSGQIKTLSVSMRNMLNNPAVQGIVVNAHDITQERKAIRALIKSEYKFKHIFESIPDLYYRTDMEGRYTLLSPSCEDVLGYKPQELVRHNETEILVRPEDRLKFLDLLRENNQVKHFETYAKKKDGTQILISYNAHNIIDSDEQIIGIEGVIRDVTSIRETERKHQTILDTLPDLIFVFDKDGKVLENNPGKTPRFLRRMNLLGKKNLEEIWPNPVNDEALLVIREVLDDGTMRGFEFEVADVNGTAHTFEARVSRLAKDNVLFIVRNITDRVRAEEASQKSQQEYRKLMETINDGILHSDKNGRILFTNDSFCLISGYTQEELIGQNAREFLHVANKGVKYSSEVDESDQLELPICSKDGEIHWCIVSRAPIYNAKQELTGTIATYTDITDRKVAEINDRKLASIVESSKDAIISVDKKGRITSWNKGAKEIFEMGEEDTVGKPLSIVSNIKSQTKLMSIMTKLKKGQGIENFEMIRENTDGRLHFINLTLSPIRNGEDGIIGASVVARDYTEKREFEEKLKLNARAMESVSDGIIMTDPNLEDNPVFYSNKAFLELAGYTRKQVLGRSANFLIGPDTDLSVSQKLHASIKSKRNFSGELLCYKKSGEVFWAYLTCSPVKDDNEKLTHFVLVIKDISMKKKMDENLLNAIVETQEKERNRIATDLHDGLGQTLTAINMYFGSLEDIFEVPEANRLKELYSSTDILIKKAMNETRLISHNLMPNTLREFGLEPGVNEMIKNLNDLGNELTINFRTNIEETRIDNKVEITLYRAIQEIINNTIKHARATILSIELNLLNNVVYIVTKDNGVGFDVTKEMKQDGIGLSGLYNRVKSIKGFIEISSKVGSGTVISMKIPLK